MPQNNTGEFEHNVTTASKILNYLISEGHACRVSDEIIDDVEASRDKLAQIDGKVGASASAADRARIKRALRDLAELPRISVTFDGVPPAHRFWLRSSPWVWLFVLFGVLPAVVMLVMIASQPSGQRWGNNYWYLLPVLLVALAFLFCWGLFAFTGVASDRKLNRMIGCSYLLTFFILVASILPFANQKIFDRLKSATTPIGVLLGCAVPSSSPSLVGTPTASGNTPPPGGSPPGGGNVAGAASTQAAQSITNIPQEVLCSPAAAAVGNFQWVINLGGMVSNVDTAHADPPRQIYQISGGLVVPLYVVVLALFGGAVSMTRRVPEYQRRAMDWQDALTNVEARERLVFQIMQVVSAPLIAVTAYYIYKPGTPAESVVIGFASGFASEPILLMIRSLVEKLSPAPVAGAANISVAVSPATASLGSKATQQFSIKVLGSTDQSVIWQVDPPGSASGTISQSGLYYAPEVAAETTVTITAHAGADRTKVGSATVRLVQPSVNVSPASATLKVGAKQQFTAQVMGLPSTNVTWTTSGGGGTIDPASGLFTATAPATVTVTATSTAAATTGTATVTVDV